eukprot:scaffold769_cov178-Ochromonas_danica.AAC.3
MSGAALCQCSSSPFPPCRSSLLWEATALALVALLSPWLVLIRYDLIAHGEAGGCDAPTEEMKQGFFGQMLVALLDLSDLIDSLHMDLARDIMARSTHQSLPRMRQARTMECMRNFHLCIYAECISLTLLSCNVLLVENGRIESNELAKSNTMKCRLLVAINHHITPSRDETGKTVCWE